MALFKTLKGLELTPKDATDDRLGILTQALGGHQQTPIDFQIDHGKEIVQAYEWPTEVGRCDLTSFNVYHAPHESGDGGLLAFGHSQDHRPDLLQFKQVLGTIDPAGVPLLTLTLKGNSADDPHYFPAWQQMSETLDRRDFLFVGDGKMGALETRLKIAREGGFYLCPLAMTGQVPDQLKDWVKNLPAPLEDIEIKTNNKGEKRCIGQGFEVERMMTGEGDQGDHEWPERWFVIRSEAQGKKQKISFLKRLEMAEKRVKSSTPKKTESAQEWQARLQNKLNEQGVGEFLKIEVHEQIAIEKRYLRPGRPTVETHTRQLKP